MATLNDGNLTLLDITKRMDPDGKPAALAELLSAHTEILDDMPWMEGNLPTGHRHTIRTGIPTPTWRKLNYGVPATKSRTEQVTDACGMLEDYALTDTGVLALSGNSAKARMVEDIAHIEGMSQTLASAIFYGDSSVNPERIMGLAPRYNDTSAESGENIIDGGGTGSDNTSVWIVGWADHTVFGIYPKGSQAGLQHRDLGEDTVQDANGNEYQAMRTHYKWDCGLAVKDWRYAVRIANIDISALTADASAGANLINLLVQGIERMQSLTGVRPVIYCNRTVRTFLRQQISNKSNVWLNMEQAAGKRVLTFDDVPVRRVDALLETEAQVT